MEANEKTTSNFIEEFVAQDIADGKVIGQVQTRFPPEPNGYLHIGHAKALCIDFGIAEKYGGKCNLRFDDTNPTKEDVGVRRTPSRTTSDWLGFQWDKLHFALGLSSTRLYEIAVELIKQGRGLRRRLRRREEMREYRGTLTEPGSNSPYRDRTVEENLDLFERMKDGEFPDGSRVLRAKIDMASPNIYMRDPTHLPHPAHAATTARATSGASTRCTTSPHPIQDAIEGVTHSLCSLEYEIHRPLYDWVVRASCGLNIRRGRSSLPA